jgi:hypothetical protein
LQEFALDRKEYYTNAPPAEDNVHFRHLALLLFSFAASCLQPGRAVNRMDYPGLNMGGQNEMKGFRPVLVRIALDRDAAQPGETLRASLTWFNAGDEATRYDYRVLVHARLLGAPEDGSYPMFGGDYAPLIETYRWVPRRVVRDDNIRIALPPNAKPGRYALLVGLYNDAGRTPVANPDLITPEFGQDRIKAAEFTVLAPGEQTAGKPFARDLAPLPAQPPGLPRTAAPAGEVVLVGGAWQARLAPDQPILRRCLNPAAHASFGGGDSEDAPLIALYRASDNHRDTSRQANVAVEYRRMDTGDPGRVAYAASVFWDGVVAVEMIFEFTAEPRGLHVAVRQIREYPPFQLMAVTFPSLISLSADAPGAALVSPVDSGRLMPFATTAPGREYLPMDWFTGTLVAMAQQKNAVALLEPDSLEDSLRVQITEGTRGRGDVGTRGNGETGKRGNGRPTTQRPNDPITLHLGSLGVRLIHRLPAKDAAHQIRVQNEMGARITFLEGPGVDWTDAAKLLRARQSGSLAPVYRSALIYKIFCDVPQSEKPITTFEQALDLIRRIAALTDNAPQIAYLVGWQYRGHDTGYPAADKVNERLGGLEGLKRLVAEAKKLNCIVSAHDNYDDAYRDSPAWDESIIARDANGEPMKGGVWAGGQSYIISPARYAASGKAQARVKDTLDRYPFRYTYHIDVLTAAPVLHDYGPARPADAAGSLLGKLAIVKAFAERGVDVSSEGLTAPFVGPVTYFWHLQRRRDTHFEGEKPIPLAPFLYHGAAGYGGAVGPNDEDVLDALLYGANWSEDLSASTPMEHILDRFFFVVLPWQKLNMRRMETYRELPDGAIRVAYDGKSWVEVNRATHAYRVMADGEVISENFKTVASVGKGRWLACARAAQTISLPPGVTKVFRLSADGTRAPVAIARGAFRAEARTPYLLTAAP